MHRARATRLPHLSTPEQREVVFHIKEDVGQLEGVRLALAVSHNKSVSSVTVRTGRQSSALMVLLEAIKHNIGTCLLHCPVRCHSRRGARQELDASGVALVFGVRAGVERRA